MRHDPPDLHALSTEQHARLAHAVMQRQAALSLRVAAIFILLVFGLPLVNYFLPDLANTPVLGFTATWLFLGVLFFPITWFLSAYFIKQSDRIEDNCRDWRSILGVEAHEPLEPEGIGDVKPAFIEEDLTHEIENRESKIESENGEGTEP
jgi:uncharacterized membrane protein (DUF485 family)